MPTTSREIHLVKRPEGLPTLDDFAMVTTEVADPADGEVLVRNLYMSVDPAMRPRTWLKTPSLPDSITMGRRQVSLSWRRSLHS